MGIDGKLKVLVVSSDAGVRDGVRALLKDPRLEIHAAETVREAFEGLDRNSFAVIVADQQLPDGSGADFLERSAVNGRNVQRFIMVVPRGQPPSSAQRALRVFSSTFGLDDAKSVVFEQLEGLRDKARRQELIAELKGANARLARREKLLDVVVQQRTVGLEQALRAVKSANRDAVRAMAESLEAKDRYTRGHCTRVSLYGLEIARESGYGDEALEMFELGGLLHDFGKIGVKDAVLNKPGKLDDEEWKAIKLHPVIGERILKMVEFYRPILPMIRHHHERFDGKGYPDGLSGEQIPRDARMLCIADAWDAMSSERIYRPALSVEVCIGELQKNRGLMFDPEFVDLFLGRRLWEAAANKFRQLGDTARLAAT